MFRVIATAFVLAVLGGCANTSGLLQNIRPAPSDIADYIADTEKGAVRLNGEALHPIEYLVASISYTNEKCHIFFEALSKNKQDSEFVDKVISAGVIAGAPLMASYHVAERTAAAITAGVLFANNTQKNYADVFAFANFKDQLKRHVFEQFGEFHKQYEIDQLVRANSSFLRTTLARDRNDASPALAYERATASGAPASERRLTSNHSVRLTELVIARDLASNYASICSLENMRRIVSEALQVTGQKKTDPTNRKNVVVVNEKGEVLREIPAPARAATGPAKALDPSSATTTTSPR